MRKPRHLWFVCAAFATMILAACGGETEEAEQAVAPTSSVTDSSDEIVTTSVADAAPGGFGEVVQPILEAKCATCHNPGGPGSPHFSLETAVDAVDYAPFLRDLVHEGVMPPWPASPLSVAFENNRGLTDEQRTSIVEWVDDGAELDVDPATPIVADSLTVLTEADAILEPAEPYQGSLDTEDDYRCQIYDPALSEQAWVTAYDFVPDQDTVVHHAIGYVLPASMRAQADDRDGEDGRPGWQCYGSSGLGEDEIFLGWAPGQGATTYPEGSGLRLEAGEFLVVQIHYHYDVENPADRSQLLLDFAEPGATLDELTVAQYVAPAEIPCASWEEGPLCDRDAALAAAVAKYGRRGVQANGINLLCRVSPDDFAHMTDGIAESSCTLPIYQFGDIVGVLGHEHEIGASFRMTLNPGRDDEQILLDIPDWDFDWQYNYELAEPITAGPGDSVRIDCSWDRSRRDAALDPAYILWADGTNDEMCFATLLVRER